MRNEPYRALVHIGGLGILYAALLYLIQLIKNPTLYYIAFITSTAFIAVLIYFLVYRPIANSDYFNY